MNKSTFQRVMENVIKESDGTVRIIPIDRRGTSKSLQQLHEEISTKVKVNNLAYDRGLRKIEESNIRV